MGIELELIVLLVLVTLGMTGFAKFEIETPWWRKLLKWFLLYALTLGLYAWVGHWSLLLPLAGALGGGTFHYVWCRRHGIHPLRATPREKYYRLRGWEAWL